MYAAQSDPSSMSGTPEYADPPAATAQAASEPPKKKQKINATTNGDSGTLTPVSEVASKKKEKEKAVAAPKAPTPPPVPAQPRLKVLPCVVCRSAEGLRLECAACRLTVHKSCYGIEDARQANKWYCDTCKNDKKESVSYVSVVRNGGYSFADLFQTYQCVLCPQQNVEQDFYELPRVSHKKKTDRDREKEKMEKELIDKAKEEYRLKQLEKGRPLMPREPLKRTADNNWVHVYCALWHAEIKFSNAARFDMVEGIGAPTLRYDAVCKLCKTTNGACTSCLQCHTTFHVGCAHSNGHIFGFDMTPVKASRRDAVPTVTMNGETGTLVAAIWCKDHVPKTGFHSMGEEVQGTGQIALQLFAREFKQADLTLTGTARKANLVDQSTRVTPHVATAQINRRASAVTAQTPTSAKHRQSNAGLLVKEESSEPPAVKSDRKCARCHIDASPRWWLCDTGMQAELNGIMDKKPVMENGNMVNGTADHPMPDAPSAVTLPPIQSHLRLDTDVAVYRSTSYLCQKCHWKKQNGIVDDEEEEEERPTSSSVLPDPQQLPLRSPQGPSYGAPPAPAMSGSWAIPGGPPPLPPNQPPPLPSWHSPALPGPPQHLPHASNSYPVPPPPLQPPPVSHVPPFHAPYPQPNGYPPYSAPPMHAPLPPAPLRPPFPPAPVSGPPPPLHLSNGPMLVNGMPSPRTMAYSPTHPHSHHSSRSTESPFTASLPAVSQYPPLHHSSAAAGRPTTPRDAMMRDAPFSVAAPAERATTGASASPSLRNLLH